MLVCDERPHIGGNAYDHYDNSGILVHKYGLHIFAAMVAERYPWVDAYTSVNEPLTTARFSALYGHSYPHARDSASFYRALLIQIRAIRAAMQRIREVRPDAKLIQTEDIGPPTSLIW